MININPINQAPNEQPTTQENAPLPDKTSKLAHALVKKCNHEPKPQAVSAMVSQVQPARPIQIPKEEILIKAYKEVQNGKITDPESIPQHRSDI